MEFFGMGSGELLLVLIIALLVMGPNRVAEVGKTLGKFVRTVKKASSDLSMQVTKELEEEKKPAITPQKKV